MKYAKMLALAAVATGALMAFIGAGIASATVLCSTTVQTCPAGQNWPAGTVFDFSLAKETSFLLTNTAGETLDTCPESTIKGEFTNAGGATATPTGKITEYTWKSCLFFTVTVEGACFEIHKIAGTSNGTVTADKCTGGNERTAVTINTVLFGSCIYAVGPGGSYGDLTEGKGSGAIFHKNSIWKKESGSAFACPETAKGTATYVLTSPSETTLSVS